MADSHSRCSSSNGDGDAGCNHLSFDFTEVILVRHGETTWNASGRIQGQTDIELNEVGRQQAIAVAHRLSKESKIAAIYSSDLKRAVETAQIIANSCAVTEVIQDPTLRERNFGDLEGVALCEAAKLKPMAHQAFLSPKADLEIPGGGESRNQLFQRCTSSLDRIATKHKGERIVVVGHGGVLRALHRRASPRKSNAGKILNASVNILHVSDSDGWIMKTWGDVTHLKQREFLENSFSSDTGSGTPKRSTEREAWEEERKKNKTEAKQNKTGVLPKKHGL